MRWKNNSIRIALELGCDMKILGFLSVNTKIKLVRCLTPHGIWYGQCMYDTEHPLIEVYQRNLSTEDPSVVRAALTAAGMTDKSIDGVMRVYESMSRAEFFEIYNQSGMDHELIGHIYNHFAGQRHDERAAVKMQIALAKTRSGVFLGRNWGEIARIMPFVLAHHKGIDELK